MKFGLVCYATTADTAGTPALKLPPLWLVPGKEIMSILSFEAI